MYLTIFKEIKKQSGWPENIPTLIQQFNRKVYDATRAAVEQTYREGVSYVGQRLKAETFFTTKDISNIQEETDLTIESFWTTIKGDAERTKEIKQEETNKEPFDTKSWLLSAVTVATTSSLAKATLSKTQQILNDKSLIGGSIGDGETETKPRIRWLTMMDERVCVVCNELDGQTWEYDDISIPVPSRGLPNGTHFRCRCVLELY